MALTDNIVSYWKLDESGGNASDSVNGNTLTNNNSATFESAKINNGTKLVITSSQSFSITDASQTGLDFTGSDFTINCWIKLGATPASDSWAIMAGKYQVSSRQYLFGIYCTTTPNYNLLVGDIGDGGSGGSQVTVSWTPTLGIWYMTTMRFTNSTKKVDFSVDGSAQGAQQTVTNNANNGTGDFELGALSGLSRFTDGVIDEMGVWSRRLTDAEITELYNSGSGLPYPFTTGSSGFLLGVET